MLHCKTIFMIRLFPYLKPYLTPNYHISNQKSPWPPEVLFIKPSLGALKGREVGIQ
jgi:hypothetical protein